MISKVLYGTVDHIWVIYDRSYTYLLYESVPKLPLAVLPVVYIEEGVPSKYEIGIGLLFQVRIQNGRVERPAVIYLYLVPGKAILTIFQHACCAAR